MIVAELNYDAHYSDMHDALQTLLLNHFPQLESGLQGDSWLWIHEGDDSVQVDTFTAMHHQVKSSSPQSDLVDRVIQVLQREFNVTVLVQPQPEAHED